MYFIFIPSLLCMFQINFKGGIDLRAKLQEHTLHFKSGLLEFTRKGSGYWKLDLPSLVCDVPGECDALCNLTRYLNTATTELVVLILTRKIDLKKQASWSKTNDLSYGSWTWVRILDSPKN